jgi:hypothetical protein
VDSPISFFSNGDSEEEIRKAQRVLGLGEDSTPLVALVRDQPYGRGSLTSEGRTASREYQAFLERNRNGRK